MFFSVYLLVKKKNKNECKTSDAWECMSIMFCLHVSEHALNLQIPDLV